MRTRIFALSGSLREGASNNIILQLVAGMVPPDVEFIIYKEMASIPAFDERDSELVNQFRQLIREADGVLICTPEYAFGVPGALKNALDWTVSTGDFDKKPVALITASSVGDKGHASLLNTLTALGTNIVEGGTLLISFIRAKLVGGQFTDKPTEEAVRNVVKALLAEIERQRNLPKEGNE
jgi:chromate reductase, NAD(P)H dehydrogenase (quinone)